MTIQLTSLARESLDHSSPLHGGLKHRLDYAALVAKVGSDVAGAIQCASTAVNVLDADDDRWHAEWFAAGEAALLHGARAARASKTSEARSNWRRASIYFSAAELYLPWEDPRRGRTVDNLKVACRQYVESLTPAGSVVRIKTSGGMAHEAYLIENVDPKSPMVICIGGPDEPKEDLIPLIEPALAWGLSVLLVEAPSGAQAGRGHHRFGAATLLMACIDHVEDASGMSGRPVAIYGVGAGASSAREVAEFDERVCAIAGDFTGVEGLRRPAILRSLIGLDGSQPAQRHRPMEAQQFGVVIPTSTEMTAVEIFDRIAGRLAGHRC